MAANGQKSGSYDVVKNYVMNKIGKFTSSDVLEHCPSVGRSSVLAALKKLTDEHLIHKKGTGRGTYYVRADSE